MTLEGQQTVTIDLDGRMFQILLHDTAGRNLMIVRTARHASDEVWMEAKERWIRLDICHQQQIIIFDRSKRNRRE
jgi:hypothetical protein